VLINQGLRSLFEGIIPRFPLFSSSSLATFSSSSFHEKSQLYLKGPRINLNVNLTTRERSEPQSNNVRLRYLKNLEVSKCFDEWLVTLFLTTPFAMLTPLDYLGTKVGCNL